MLKNLITKNFYINLLKNYSLIIVFLIVASALYQINNVKKWRWDNAVIYWDVISYYAYLPATFIYHDLSLSFATPDYKEHPISFWPSKAPNGGKVIKTSMGLSILYSPFFFLGHITAIIQGKDTGGFSNPYKFWLLISGVFYLGLGLFVLSKILLKYFSRLITSITLIIIVAGTNLFYYSTVEAPMSHVYSFCLFIIFVWLSIKWHDKPNFKNTILIGLLTGLISLVRPSNILIFIFFLLYGITSFNDLKERILFFFKKWQYPIIIAFCIFIIWIPQFLYWKFVTDQYFYWSYGSNENFFFNDPKIFKALFNFRKGWFIYTPVMIFSIFGIFLLYRKNKDFFFPILIFIILNVYVLSSWYCWWYGGGFGHRGMIDSYGLLAIPLATFLQWVGNSKVLLKSIFITFITLFTALGTFHTIQYYYGAIHWDSMTKEAYWDSFGRTEPSEKFQSLLKSPDYGAAEKGDRDQ